MITITEKAMKELQKLLPPKDSPDKVSFLRIFVQGGGCCGLHYGIKAEEEYSSNDIILNFVKFIILVDLVSASYLKGSRVDHDPAYGFMVINPNTKSACGSCQAALK